MSKEPRAHAAPTLGVQEDQCGLRTGRQKLTPLQQALAASLASAPSSVEETRPQGLAESTPPAPTPDPEPDSLGYQTFLGTFRKQWRKDTVGSQFVEKEMRRAAIVQWHGMDPDMRAIMAGDDDAPSARGGTRRGAEKASGMQTPLLCPVCETPFADKQSLQCHTAVCKPPSPTKVLGKRQASARNKRDQASSSPSKVTKVANCGSAARGRSRQAAAAGL